MDTETMSYTGLLHAGAGTALLLVQLGALMPGFLPVLALTGVLLALVLVPMLVLGLALALLLAPPAAAWWAISRGRRKRRRSAQRRAAAPVAGGPRPA